MKTKYLYFLIAAVAIGAAVYPVLYAQITGSASGSNPFGCTPLIPCAGPSPGFESCVSSCTIYMENSTFVPGTVNVTVGAKVTWVNLDAFAHTSTSLNSTGWDTDFIAPGRSTTVVFGNNYALGTYYYHCDVHPQMIGIINLVQ
ncbi:MAG: cupredoxin domain-containing protein [Thaumarchaeota archaeon]|nr:cupredoxin domain-containing protein [Nitrososphaerota archaeon]